MAQPLYGSREGLPDRLKKWVERLGKDKSLSFPGLGLIEDLKAAAAALNDEPDAPNMEFDL